MAHVNFDSSLLPGLQADRVSVKRGVYLRRVEAHGEIRLGGATIGADLDCDEATITAGKNGMALGADNATVRGYVFLRKVFAFGEIRLLSSKIGSNLELNGTNVAAGGTGYALNADSANVTGSVFLNDGWSATGRIDLVGAEIGAHLVLAQRASTTKGRVVEAVLISARAGALLADFASWNGMNYQLDGFRYDRLGVSGSLDSRRAWLAGAVEADASDFRPQPWEQLTRVLRAAGHEDDARAIDKDRRTRLRSQRRPSWCRLIAKMEHRTKNNGGWRSRVFSRSSTLIGAAAGAFWWALTWAFMGVLAGEGYARRRLIGLLLFFWLLGWGFYFEAAEQGWIAPAQPIMLIAETDGPGGDRVSLASLCAPDWRNCPHLPDGYPAFTSWVYSFDVILPVIGIGQEKHWAPVYLTLDDARVGPPPMEIFDLSLGDCTGPILRAVFWGQTILGYALGAIIAAFISGVMRRD